MMVSEMQGALLTAVTGERASRNPTVLDPFLGAGTALAETMRLGVPFVGYDINPLAVLISRVRAEAPVHLDVHLALTRVIAAAKSDRRGVTERGPWVTKWFRPDVARALSRVSRAVRAEEDPRVRRALWVAVAEVVRTSGNMRVGRPKLQTRPVAELGRTIDVLDRLRAATERVTRERDRHTHDLHPETIGRDGQYLPGSVIRRSDIREARWPEDMPAAEIVLTSPPYGDNHTTMPYGQQSFLPLKWIDINDVDPNLDTRLTAASKALDTASLGGSRRFAPDRVAEAVARSATLSQTLEPLAGRIEPWQRVASFFADLNAAWDRILSLCASDAHLIITIGDRTVAGRPVPTGRILVELLESRGARLQATLERPITKNRRLAPRNAFAQSTIASERVLIMQRCFA